MRSGKWHYLTVSGRPAFDGVFDYAEDFFEGRAVAGLDNNFGLIDREGNQVLPIAFEEVRWIGAEGIVIATCDGKTALYNRMGERLSPLEWDWLGDLEDGMIAAELDGRFGYITTSGETAIPFRFDNAFDFRGGQAIVEIAGAEYSIDLRGEVIMA
jgi:hypothetical protein